MTNCSGLEDETFAAIRKMAWISEKLGEPMANVSLSWAREMPGITSLLMGARNQSQLERNLASLVRHYRKEMSQFITLMKLNIAIVQSAPCLLWLIE